MTDITELAQSLKAAAEKATQGNWRAFKYHDGRCGIGGGHHDEIMVCEHISKRRPHDAEFIALANPANILALVEALEKARGMESYWKTQCRGITDHCEELQARIAELESRTVTVKLPKPHAHLIWIQAGHAPDDYWDDVAVSHSEKDRCCDGSERYPVYARWEIEEMLAAAGIKVEAE
ncbi:TPA: ead/Ea22-like family protein [Klebsiella pneumoniae subsp. pneumoniae]|nr:ead/Ea22-like family protein [Klebsiella pneumoniae subsp. pneumoniae]